MSRYFVRMSRARSFWVEDETYCAPANNSLPVVCDHEAMDTGLVDAGGNTIWRGPNPIGFLWDLEAEQD